MTIKNIFKNKKLNLILFTLILTLSTVLSYEFLYTKEYYFSCEGEYRNEYVNLVYKDNSTNDKNMDFTTHLREKKYLKENIRIKIRGFGFRKTINKWEDYNCSIDDETQINCSKISNKLFPEIKGMIRDSANFDFLNLKYSRSEFHRISDVNKIGKIDSASDMNCIKISKPFD
jgi:hypothetical protein